MLINTISRKEIAEKTGMTQESISIALARVPIVSRTGSFVYNTDEALEAVEQYCLKKRRHWDDLVRKYDQHIESIRKMKVKKDVHA